MGLMRNSINVEGLAKESDFPTDVNGHIIKYSEVETILIPNNKPEAKSISDIKVKLKITDERTLNGGFGKTMVLGGTKSYKVSYVENSPEAIRCTANIEEPYISCIDLPNDIEKTSKANTYIIDAYFHLMDSRKIYAHFVYLIHVLRNDHFHDEVDNEIKDDAIPDSAMSYEINNPLYDIEEEIL